MATFRSFWQGGFEGADHINPHGIRLSMNEVNGHASRFAEDYANLNRFGINTIRESVGWRIAAVNNKAQYQTLREKMHAALNHNIQINWTLCHYGFPEHITFFSSDFISRFADWSFKIADYLKNYYTQSPIYSPINEISFLSWGISVGLFPAGHDARLRDPDLVKQQLVRAALAACHAILDADNRARFLHCDPIINLVVDQSSAACHEHAKAMNQAQFQAWDMLSGRTNPELGGAPHLLDMVGANYYHSNQWEADSGLPLDWHLGDPRRLPLHTLLKKVYQRYNTPVLLAETSHFGSGRSAWLNDITAQVAQAQLNGVEISGICLYPVIDRPLWENPDHWPQAGLWDVTSGEGAAHARILHASYAHTLLNCQRQLRHFQRFVIRAEQKKELAMNHHTLIVFSHLRWGFVYQRPQHILSRLAQYFRIIFIEEPVYDSGEPYLNQYQAGPNINVIVPHSNIDACGFHDSQISILKPLFSGLIEPHDRPVVWFYTPMALPLLTSYKPAAIIYDCMDELSAFDKAPRQMRQRESALLGCADLVFTGGSSLYEAKKARHSAVYCFPSSVDTAHFEQALDRSNGHPLQKMLPSQRLGYYGVIDERLDMALIAKLADMHPDWQVIMVGPIVKIDPSTLPQRDNIYWFGQQPYAALPHFLADWDVCLMPFALNDATRYISPTKVLEYMAAGLPIVSSAIPDVIKHYSNLVSIADSHDRFITLCAEALQLTPQARETMINGMASVLANTSWDKTANAMFELISKKVLSGESESVESFTDKITGSSVSLPEGNTVECLILGGGPTGLSAAYHYGKNTILLEKNAHTGGWCRSIYDRGFTFDHAGHIMFTNDPYVLKLYDLLLGSNQHWQVREAWVYSHEVYTRYPFQSALFGLPPKVISECILGAIEARYGLVEAKEPEPEPDPGQADELAHEDCCADGGMNELKCRLTSDIHPTENFERFIYSTWGKGIAEHFAIPYNRKLWKVPLSEMDTSWLGGRVPLPDLNQIITGALAPLGRQLGPNARFGYPLKGGFQALMDGFLPHMKGELRTDAEIVNIFPREHMVVLANGHKYHFQQLISTLPLPELVRLIGGEAPPSIRAAAQTLRHVSVRCVNLGINRPALSDKHWIYYPGDTIFHRIFLQGNASPHCNPDGGFGLTCEMTYCPGYPLALEGQALIQRCIEDCIRVGLFTSEDKVICANQVDMPYAYVVYDHQRRKNVALIRDWLLQQDITLSGRYSEWEYYNSDHAFLAGKRAAESVASRLITLKSSA
ncbi:MAG: NAD(P)-binding protein [Pantoea sp.]|uniref:NAD(P)-binding protein n=1 Tax=Pantoea sp. TaxID=69393 RepID=UPI0023A03CE5|nr:NAD(P)-binding protein [Pantoea sp.]MDE1186212.1 NAD(P)-binding protein [Pantoea sp.]